MPLEYLGTLMHPYKSFPLEPETKDGSESRTEFRIRIREFGFRIIFWVF